MTGNFRLINRKCFQSNSWNRLSYRVRHRSYNGVTDRSEVVDFKTGVSGTFGQWPKYNPKDILSVLQNQ